MKIEIISQILDELDPSSLYTLNGIPTDQSSFVELAICTNPVEAIKWSDIESNYPTYESAYAFKEMRKIRNELLEASDIEVLPDRTPSDKIKAYRQALRDIPNSENPTYDTEGKLVVNWPIKP